MNNLIIELQETNAAAEGKSRSRIFEFVELTKPRISMMVLVTVAITAFVSAEVFQLWLVIHTLVGVALISASGAAWNQFIERYTDWLMPRTRNRPLPSNSLSVTEVAVFGAVTFGIGIAYLATLVNWPAALAALITWVLYSWVYTPLKTITSLNTYVGAVAGALPVLIGALGVGETIPAIGWAIFLILFLWQFPHFMAIAWKYQDDYRAAGLKMFPVTDPTLKSTRWHALLFAILLLPTAGWAFWLVAGASLLWQFLGGLVGAMYLAAALAFFREQNRRTSRQLLLASVFHLPILLLLIMLAKYF